MGILDSIGASLLVNNQAVIHGATITFTSYIVKRSNDGGKAVDMEDVDLSTGARASRLIFKRDNKATLELICKSDAAYTTDFPEGDMCTHAGLTAYFCDKATAEKDRGAVKLSVELTNIGIT